MGLMEKVVSLCKRRGFVYPASEIYGGLNSCWDFGPLGVELKRNVRDAWWRAMVRERDDVVGLDSAILQHPRVWEASGHVANFSDPLVDCTKCKKRFRADHIGVPYQSANGAWLHPETGAPMEESEARAMLATKKCPECEGALTPPRRFNLMFQTFLGAVVEDAARVYLRPETAQGIFTNFVNVLNSSRKKPPFGIAQIGKSFRNEITPGNFVFRTREFEQGEMEFFVPPADGEKWFDYWRKERFAWYSKFGVRPSKLRLRDHAKDELAHYSSGCSDVEYQYPFGWGELEGIANRTDFDLKQHAQHSGKDLSFFDEESKTRYVPHVIEPAAGIDRAALTFIVDAYEETTVKDEARVVLHLHPKIAPVTAAVFPLVKKEGMPEKASEIEKELRANFATVIEANASIGKRYARQDEIGTPFCITVDGQTMQDDTVTLRDRDTLIQDRVKTGELRAALDAKIRDWKRVDSVG
ncbi:MAG: glycine--tRNA ligase [Planctomycetes bacterium]|nr:glycine--tRNA ligase [Planctomycetota bacterium]